MSDDPKTDDEREALIRQIMDKFGVNRLKATEMADVTLGLSKGDLVDVPEEGD